MTLPDKLLSDVSNQQSQSIPWNDPVFSERLLLLHLSQEHDWASRRLAIIEKQIGWIARQLPVNSSSRILDLCCGPGLYTHRLAILGHRCTGIDFSPASIAYARQAAEQNQLDINYILADLRDYEIEGKYNLIMMTFGEFNIFSKQDIKKIFINAFGALCDGGILMVEAYTYDEVRRIGHFPEQRHSVPYGIFSDRPYFCQQSQLWDETNAVTNTHYLIVDLHDMKLRQYRSSMQAYTQVQYGDFFESLGLFDIRKVHESDWPAGSHFSGMLQVFCGHREILDIN